MPNMPKTQSKMEFDCKGVCLFYMEGGGRREGGAGAGKGRCQGNLGEESREGLGQGQQ